MSEIQFTDSLNGFDYEITQTFVCGSRKTGEPSKYVNTLIIKEGGNIALDTFWEGEESEAYLKMKAKEEVSWFIENQNLFISKKKTCPHLIKAERARHDLYKPQRNAIRVEIIELSDRCALKMPKHWNKAARERAYIDILNGFILDFGVCGGVCPKC